ncbi:hypothetical protein [Paenibacillus sp. y28]|uniref:hypothetical protein n=1 Tax=Paenibacillus sp. y28 TaxID=3129110 RepID=UPI003016CD6B
MLSVLLIGFLLLTAGCFRASSPSDPEAQTVELQSLNERQLFVFFHALLDMDQRDGMKITAVQAGQLLPLVKKSIEAGELTQSEHQQAYDLLQPVQQAYYDTMLLKQQAMHAGDQDFKAFTPEEQARIYEEISRRREQQDEAAQQSLQPEAEELSPSGVSVEQQLLQLLDQRAGRAEGTAG